MNRRDFLKGAVMLGVGAEADAAGGARAAAAEYYEEPARKLPVRPFDVVVAGAGTGGVVAALAAARQGARTALIERKGYPGGTVVEGGTALHSFYNLWKAFPGVAKRQVVKGIPQEIVDRLVKAGGTSGHAEMTKGFDYDSVCTAIDTEIYKLVTFEMLQEAGRGETRPKDRIIPPAGGRLLQPAEDRQSLDRRRPGDPAPGRGHPRRRLRRADPRAAPPGDPRAGPGAPRRRRPRSQAATRTQGRLLLRVPPVPPAGGDPV